MKNANLLLVAVSILGVGFLMCLGGIIWLASANPARSIPDILVGTTTLIVGTIAGILVPSDRSEVVTRRAVAKRES